MKTIFNKILDLEVATDLGTGDATSIACINTSAKATAKFNAREKITISGLDLSAQYLMEKTFSVEQHFTDKQVAQAGDCLLTVKGNARDILVYERTVLNMLQHMCAIATSTAKYVEQVKHTKAVILDTRKTIAGLRHIQKYAVKCGGGQNHRIGLYDAILLKDNHIAASGGIENAINNIGKTELPVIVECDTLEQIQKALDLGITRVLADNMCNGQDCSKLKQALELCQGKAKVEASGGITLDNVKAAAEAGADYISIGALTHTITAVDIGLDFIQE